MAIAKTILFLEDQLHSSNAVSEIEAVSNTHKGNMHNVRDSNYLTYWKPLDDLVTNAHIRADFVAIDAISVDFETVYCCIAYDPRNVDQTDIILQYDSADNPSFAGATGAGTFTIDTTDEYPTCQWLSFTMPSPSKRYWRLMQRFAARSGAGRTIPIFYWGMYGPGHVLDLDTAGNKPGPGAGRHDFLGSGHGVAGPGGVLAVNDPGRSQQRFEITVTPANATIFEKLRDAILKGDVLGRSFFVQFEGLRNEAEANFQLCRIDAASWDTMRGKMGSYEITLPLLTEAFV
jgi:hypothetical protein